MATQEITLNLPDPIYDQLRQAAERSHRSIDDLIIEAVISAAPTLDTDRSLYPRVARRHIRCTEPMARLPNLQ